MKKILLYGKKLPVAYTSEQSEQVDLGFKITRIQHRNINMPDDYDKVAIFEVFNENLIESFNRPWTIEYTYTIVYHHFCSLGASA